MKHYIKFLIKFILSIILKSYRFIRLSPNVYGSIFFFDKKKKEIFRVYSRERMDSITADEIFTNHCYDLSFLTRYDELIKKYFSIIKSNKIPLIIDCGSNIGLSARYFAEFFPKAKIVAIEPEINNFNLMKRNCEKFKNIIFLNAAIGSEKGFVSIDTSSHDNRAFRTIISNNPNLTKVITINEIFEQNSIDIPFIIKIDIEGFEDNLFKKNTNWVRKTPLIIVEPHDWMLPSKGVFKNFLKTISSQDRDFVINGENVFSLVNETKNQCN